MATKKVDLPEIGAVKLYKRKGTRSIRLSIDSAGEVRVTLPYWLPFEAGTKFALSKRTWIAKQMQQQTAAPITHGQAVGKSHHIYFRPAPAGTRVSSRVDGTAIRVSYPTFLATTDADVQKSAEAACVRALRAQAEALLPQRLQALAATHRLTYHSIQVKRLKGRWGSCDAEANIVLNVFLMQLPWPLIDYVLLHELIHTEVLHHGPDFWQLFEAHLPGAKNYRREIRAYRPAVG
jgi:predicted metal-dependent hydrolase